MHRDVTPAPMPCSNSPIGGLHNTRPTAGVYKCSLKTPKMTDHAPEKPVKVSHLCQKATQVVLQVYNLTSIQIWSVDRSAGLAISKTYGSRLPPPRTDRRRGEADRPRQTRPKHGRRAEAEGESETPITPVTRYTARGHRMTRTRRRGCARAETSPRPQKRAERPPDAQNERMVGRVPAQRQKPFRGGQRRHSRQPAGRVSERVGSGSK